MAHVVYSFDVSLKRTTIRYATSSRYNRQKAQISKIESGKRDLSFSTIIRAFRAMGISAKLDMGSLGVYAF